MARRMTEDKFIEKYKPERDKEGNVYVMRDPYRDWPRIQAARRKRKLWTVVDADGRLYLVSGYHYVNREYYVICKVAHTGPEIEIKLG